MLLRDTYSRLSSHFLIEYFREQPAGRFAEKFGIVAPMSCVLSEDMVKGYYYLPESVESDRDKMIFLRQYGARKQHGVWTVYFNSDFYTDLETIRSLSELPSVIMDDVQLVNGRHVFHARFSGMYMKDVSDMIVRTVSENQNFQIMNYGMNPGIDYIISGISVDRKRSVRAVRIVVENYPEERYGAFTVPDGTAREIKYFAEGSSQKGLYYFPDTMDEKPSSAFTKISDSHNYFEGPLRSEILMFLSTFGKNIPMMSLSMAHKFSGERLIIEYLIDEWSSELLIRRVKEAKEKFSNTSIYLDYAAAVSSEVRVP